MSKSRFLAVFLAISTTLISLAGCSGGNSGSDTASLNACLGCGTAGATSDNDAAAAGSDDSEDDSDPVATKKPASSDSENADASDSETDVSDDDDDSAPTSDDANSASDDDDDSTGSDNDPVEDSDPVSQDEKKNTTSEGNVLPDIPEIEGCEPYEILCEGVCTDPYEDANNCGACGRACGTGEFCAGSECLCDTDPTGLGRIQICDDACTDTHTDRHNCGACGKECVFDCAEGRCAEPNEIGYGDAHACVATTGGTVWCWGDNSSKQLGNESDEFSTLPVRITEISGAMHIAAGSKHTCALARFEDTTGEEVHEVYCWGANDQDQLGIDGPSQPVSTPSPVQNLVEYDVDRASLSASGTGTCIVLGHTKLCWGTLDATDTDPPENDFACEIRPYDPDTFTPSQVWCWGNNDHGQLGNGTTASSLTPTLVGNGTD